MKLNRLLSLFIALFLCVHLHAQLVVNNTTMTPQQLVENVLAGAGVTVFNVTFNGGSGAVITQQCGSFNGTASNIGVANGIMLGSGNVQVAVGPNNQEGASMGGSGNEGTDPDLAAITPNQIYDEAILEFDFIPQGDSVSFRYVFASEEYDEYVCGDVNDAFGFFLSGPGITGPYINNARNIALVPGTNTPVSINTVNIGEPGYTTGILFPDPSNCDAIDPNWENYSVYYTQNTQNTVQYDGFTVVLTAKAAVQCGETYHIKLAIGDAGDPVWDSGVFLEAGSFGSSSVSIAVATVTGDTAVYEGCTEASFIFTRPSNQVIDTLVVEYDISGTATEGTDYNTLINPVTFLPGQDTVIITLIPTQDNVTEGIETVILTAYVVNQCGDTIETQGLLYIFEKPEIIITENDPVISCAADSVLMTASAAGGFPPYDYSWSNGLTGPQVYGQVNPVTAPNEYIVTVTDACGFQEEDTVTITFNSSTPLVIVETDTTILCANDSVPLSVVVSGGSAPYTYSWNTGVSDSLIYGEIYTNGQTDYYITVTDACGSQLTDTATLILNQTLIIDSMLQFPATCNPDGSVAGYASGFTGTPAYNWSGPGPDSQNGVNAAVFENIPPGMYYFTVTDDVCTVSDSIEVTQDAAPQANFTASTVSGCSPLEVNFTNNSQNASTYNWIFGNGQTATVSNTSGQQVVYTSDAVVRLIAIEGNCRDTLDITINVNACGCMDPLAINYDPLAEVSDGSCFYPQPVVEVPNIFTPNGDNANDLFFLPSQDVLNIQMWVFNRWGNLMFEGNSISPAWDGKVNGEKAQEGTYFLKYKVTGLNNQLIEGHGFFQLVIAE